jgi:hypothetical protein
VGVFSSAYGATGESLPEVPPATPTPPAGYGTLQGTISFRARADATDRVSLSLQDTSTGVVTDYDVLTDSSGHYTVADVPAGTYNILCHSPPYLRKLASAISVPAGGTATVDFLKLGAGDLTDDNEIAFDDVAVLSSLYGSSGDSLP